MCGIIGYCGHRPAVPVIIEGLRRLEYRGYDSAGVAFLQGKDLVTVRAEGKLANLEAKLKRLDDTQATALMVWAAAFWVSRNCSAENLDDYIRGY